VQQVCQEAASAGPAFVEGVRRVRAACLLLERVCGQEVREAARAVQVFARGLSACFWVFPSGLDACLRLREAVEQEEDVA